MTSKDPGATEHALIDLIYRHLQENGYKKAASALKKHAPQVESTDVKVSLDDIFKRWMSEKWENKHSEGTCSESATNAARNTGSEKKVKSQTPAAARNQKRKRTETKTKTRKRAGAAEGQKAEHGSTGRTTGQDSDSDSSLDVEKWKRLALQLSDADIAKMDVFTSTASSTKKRKPAPRKKKQDQTMKNSKASPKKAEVKTTSPSTKTVKVGSPLKPAAFSIGESDKVQPPSNSAVFTEPNIVSPEGKMGTSLSDQVVTPKTGVSNGFSESDRSKVKRKKKHSISESEKTDDNVELKPTDSPGKKAKSKKDAKPGRLETTPSVTDPEAGVQKSQCDPDSAQLSESHSSQQTGNTKTKKHKSKKDKNVAPVAAPIQTGTEDATGSLTSAQSKIHQISDDSAQTPSKKAKSKKSKQPLEAGDVTMPSAERQIKADDSHSKPQQAETLSTAVIETKSLVESVEKQSKKAKKSSLKANGTENPSEASTGILEPLNSETPSKKAKTTKASEASQDDSPSKKAVVEVGEGQDTQSSSLILDHTGSHVKKKKRKRAERAGENVTGFKSSTECENSGADASLVPAGNGAENQGQESVSAVAEEGNPEPKKKKKKKKDKEMSKNDDHVEEVAPTSPAEEIADSLPSSQKKKKKKKEKHRDEEMLCVVTPASEEASPKKKKKSSKKEKEHADVSEQGLI